MPSNMSNISHACVTIIRCQVSSRFQELLSILLEWFFRAENHKFSFAGNFYFWVLLPGRKTTFQVHRKLDAIGHAKPFLIYLRIAQ